MLEYCYQRSVTRGVFVNSSYLFGRKFRVPVWGRINKLSIPTHSVDQGGACWFWCFVDHKLGLLLNLTNPQRINIPSCPSMTNDHLLHHTEGRDDQPWTPSMYAFFCKVGRCQRESLDLIPALSSMAYHN